MGCFYVGFDYKNRKNGYFKIGETSKSNPANRLANIRRTDSFQCLGYISFEEDTKADRLYIESYVRMKLARVEKMENVQNDHFLYDIQQGHKYEQANAIAEKALQYAIDACEEIGLAYEIGTKTYKRS